MSGSKGGKYGTEGRKTNKQQKGVTKREEDGREKNYTEIRSRNQYPVFMGDTVLQRETFYIKSLLKVN